jgi:hypothetical protein
MLSIHFGSHKSARKPYGCFGCRAIESWKMHGTSLMREQPSPS